MYVQGVSTRKVTEIMCELCGLDISSSQFSRVTKLLDGEFGAWRTRPLEEYPYGTFGVRAGTAQLLARTGWSCPPTTDSTCRRPE